MEPNSNTLPSNEAEAMPSFFKSLTTSESHPIASWQYLEAFITRDPQLKIITETYRQRLEVSKKFADEYKPVSPAITASALMDGYGKSLANFRKPTFHLQLDFDKIPKDKMPLIAQLIRQDTHVKISYVTISGRGFRVICPYAPLEDDDVSTLELFDLMIHKAMEHFIQLLGIAPDKACTDITRSCGLAYDPKAYFHWNAQPFRLDAGDLKALYTRKAKEAKYAKPQPSKPTARKSPATSKPVAIDEAAPHVKHLLTQWGYQFEAGRHNEYIVHFAKVCILYGIAQDEAVAYATKEFGPSYDKTAEVMKSCYKHTEHFGEWHFYRKGDGYGERAKVKVVKQWLRTRYDFHQNMVTGFYELRSKMVITGKYFHWTRIDDNIENSLWAEMDEQGLSVPCKKLHDIINSDFCTPYDPLDEYLRGLEPWDKEKDPDYIDQLADRIRIVDKPEYLHTQEWFRYFFKKWLVAMVVAWVTLKVVNQTILIFVGKGGIFKTTFFAYLLPPQLRQYFINDSTACYTDKDFMEAFSSKAMMCLDEFEIVFGKNLSAFKSNITKLSFSIRRPYDKYRSELPHRASLAGTTNTQQFITDEENRRYSPWIVESIQSPIDDPFDYDHVFAEAVALGKEVMDRKEKHPSDWTFWLTRDDIEKMRQHNKLFMVSNYAEEQILRFYRVPDEDTDPTYIKFRYNAEILEKIGSSPALRQSLSNQNIGSIMARLGFKKLHRHKGNGWAVIEKEGGEINTESSVTYRELSDSH